MSTMRCCPARARLAHARADAVGADQEVGFDGGAALEPRNRPLALLLQVDQPVADMQALGRHGAAQKLGEIAAMEVIVRRTEGRLDLRPQRRPLQGAAIVPAPLIDGGRPHADAIHRGLQAKPHQEARSVGADLDAGADLADARRLLVDVDVEPRLQQMQRRGQAANAAADDRDPHACFAVWRWA
jgi:hypothetical protein